MPLCGKPIPPGKEPGGTGSCNLEAHGEETSCSWNDAQADPFAEIPADVVVECPSCNAALQLVDLLRQLVPTSSPEASETPPADDPTDPSTAA